MQNSEIVSAAFGRFWKTPLGILIFGLFLNIYFETVYPACVVFNQNIPLSRSRAGGAGWAIAIELFWLCHLLYAKNIIKKFVFFRDPSFNDHASAYLSALCYFSRVWSSNAARTRNAGAFAVFFFFFTLAALRVILFDVRDLQRQISWQRERYTLINSPLHIFWGLVSVEFPVEFPWQSMNEGCWGV